MGVDFAGTLNDEQYRAATAGDGPLLILAAAGTGKTRTLVHRVAYLVEEGVSPERILLLTFTNRAAREMLERAVELVGREVGGMWGGTFHHMSNRILRRYAGLVGFRPDYAILDQDDTRGIISDCVKKLGLRRKEFPRRDVLHGLFSAATNSVRDLRELVEERFERLEVDPADILAVHAAYEARKRELNALDFDDLLTKCLTLLSENPDVLARYQDRFLYVLVDEYQDTNPIQAELVDLLAARNRNLFVVGDDFQSIYSWRGADYRNILSFPDRYTDTEIFKLETNYRSVPEILSVANACIAGNPHQFQKVLRATREAYHRPTCVFLRDGDAQGRYVVSEVQRLRRAGYRFSDIAILYRAHFHAMEVQLALSHAHIPYMITSGVRFFEQAHIKDVCAFLRLLVNPGDALAFERLLGLIKGVGPRTVERLWLALGRGFSAGDASQRRLVRDKLRGVARTEWEAIEGAMVRSCDGVSDGNTALGGFVDAFYGGYAEASFDNADKRLEDIQEMGAYLTRFPGLEAFLSEVALLTNLDAESENVHGGGDEALRLSTVHQAKGLEWPAVIVLWVAEGMFPSNRSLEESGEGEAEERRLFYVAVTRAKDELCLCVPEMRRMRDGGVFFCRPSRFVDELDPALVRQIRPGYF